MQILHMHVEIAGAVDLGSRLASYPGSDYAGAEKRAWYILHAHALNFQRILWICILSVFLHV